VAGGPGALVESFTLAGDPINNFLPDAPVLLSPNSTYYFALGYPLGNSTLTDWFYSDTDLSSDGPATMQQGWFSSSQGAIWQTGSFMSDRRLLFEVVPEPALNSSAGAAFAVLAGLRTRRRRRP
jgi:hypothetical protein